MTDAVVASGTAEDRADERCAVHPARPAVDNCPVCGRPRCGADARSAPGGGCLQCQGVVAEARPQAPREHELIQVIAALLSSLLLGLLLAPVVSEYVGASGFAEITPFLLGLACASTAAAVARTHGRGRIDVIVRVIGGLAAVLGTAFAFRLVPGTEDPFGPAGTVLPPYACAIAGAFVSRLFR